MRTKTYLEKEKKRIVVRVIGNDKLEARHMLLKNNEEADTVFKSILILADKLKKEVKLYDENSAKIADFDYIKTMETTVSIKAKPRKYKANIINEKENVKVKTA